MKKILILSLVCLLYGSCRIWFKTPQLSDIRVEYNKGNYVACLEKVDKYIEKKNINSDSFYAAQKIRAQSFYKLGTYEQCLKTINQIIDRFLLDTLLYEIRGDCYQYLDKNQLALRDYTILIQRFHSCNGFSKRGRLYIVLGDIELANNDIDYALKLDSTNFSALNSKGLIFYSNGDFQNALLFFKKAISVESNKSTYFNIAEAFGKMQTMDSACFYYKVAADFGYSPAKEELLKKCQY